MIGWAITFLLIALVAGLFGIAGVVVEMATIVFFVAIILFAIATIVGLIRGQTPTVS